MNIFFSITYKLLWLVQKKKFGVFGEDQQKKANIFQFCADGGTNMLHWKRHMNFST